ncbi:SAVED domain-containing protein [Paenibacillus polymyxa]|uniref:SAVED domain-containing protein n=1 Tax=Paenibacillus polymyxa TaxID=1406 RepID=UPI002019951F|nr:SAVED domain-containing protein [Paenibacillus polymyxa]UQQ36193.1 SAVED domain-containing protein [Paenibacillus polymyxa]
MNTIMKYAKKFLKRRHEKWITRSLVGAGTVILLSGASQSIWMSFLVSIYNDRFNKNIPDPNGSINYLYLTICVVVGGGLIWLGLNFYFRTKENEKSKSMVLIQHCSIQTVSYANIDKDLSDYSLENYPINQLEELMNIDSGSIHHALREQEKAVERISSRINGSSDIEVAYLGLAHIPLTVLFGYQLSDKVNVSFYEWNQNDLKWGAIESDTDFVFPTLFINTKDTVQDAQSTKEVVIKIGVTYPIPGEDIQEIQLHKLNSYYLHLNPPHRNAIVSLEQLKTYKRIFRDLLDDINQKYPHLQRIHLFFAGQPSLAYILGSAITSRMDNEIWVYNHTRTETPKYKWCIRLPLRNRPIELKINESRG